MPDDGSCLFHSLAALKGGMDAERMRVCLAAHTADHPLLTLGGNRQAVWVSMEIGV